MVRVFVVVADDMHQWHAKFKLKVSKIKTEADKVWREKNDVQRFQLSLASGDFEKQ